ncbi:MAG: LytTR family transcriptional regulator, partial [Chloroflexi bacterium]|nr:LytTR family transcriptional regulator [Chloroflexota bacterium]
MLINIKRFPVRSEPGRIILLDREDIYYVEAEGDDSLIRTARKKRYPHVEPLETIESRLPSPPFFRIHRS